MFELNIFFIFLIKIRIRQKFYNSDHLLPVCMCIICSAISRLEPCFCYVPSRKDRGTIIKALGKSSPYKLSMRRKMGGGGKRLYSKF